MSLRLLGGIAAHGRVVDADGNPVRHAKLWMSGDRGEHATLLFEDPDLANDSTFTIAPISVEALSLTAYDERGTHRSAPITLRKNEGSGDRDVTLRLQREPYAVILHGRLVGPDQRPLVASHPFLANLARNAGHGSSSIQPHVWPVMGELPEIGKAYASVAVGETSYDGKRGEFTCTAPLDEERRPTCIVVEAGLVVVAAMPLDEALLAPDDEVHEVPDLVVADTARPPAPTRAELDISVVDAATHQLLGRETRVAILVRLDGGATSLLSNEGSAHHLQSVQPCRASIVASSRGYVPDWIDGDFTARVEPYSMTIALQPALRAIRGVVLDSEQRPVAGARLCWLAESEGGYRGTALEPVTSDATGRFEFAAVGAVRGRLAVEAEHFVPAFADVEAADHDTVAKVELSHGVSVTFRVAADADGRELRGVLRITQADGSIVRDDWDLRFTRFSRSWPRTLTLAPGPYRYHVDFVTRADADGEFVASEGAEVVTLHAR